MLKDRHVISLADLTRDELLLILDTADALKLKLKYGELYQCVDRRRLGMFLGERITESLMEEARHQATQEIDPITDLRSTAWYRKEVAKVMTRDAIKLAWERAGL